MSLLKQHYFSEWQAQTIYMKQYGEVSILYMLTIFIDNLLPFLYKNGYNVDIATNALGNTIASMLYKLDYNRHYLFPIERNIQFDEYYYHFEYIINWEDYWDYWNYLTNDFFKEAEIHILHIIWSYIDIDTSSAHIRYLEMMESDDSEDDISKKLKNIDPYLLDQLNASNHYKFTRFENS